MIKFITRLNQIQLRADVRTRGTNATVEDLLFLKEDIGYSGCPQAVNSICPEMPNLIAPL